MADLFDRQKSQELFNTNSKLIIPLAEKLRPKSISEFIGQKHLITKNGSLNNVLNSKILPSIIFWGPAGCGKTTLALLLAKTCNLKVFTLSAVHSNLGDLKQVFAYALKAGTVCLFIDEIHRFNKAQQDAFLPELEKGYVILLGATTENPSFEINSALLSRMKVVTLNPLNSDELKEIFNQCLKAENNNYDFHQDAIDALINYADGDARNLINNFEYLVSNKNLLEKQITLKDVSQALNKRMLKYDKAGDEHFNLISALHKSIRGSDPDAALYWFSRMILGGEDPNYIARRLLRMSYEDIGIADPTSAQIVLCAWQSYQRLGSPEGEIALAQAVIYLALAPRSNSVYKAFNMAYAFAKKNNSLAPPSTILNAPTTLMKNLGYGKDYIYDHDSDEKFSGQNYFPDGINHTSFYNPSSLGFEKHLSENLEKLKKLRQEIQNRNPK